MLWRHALDDLAGHVWILAKGGVDVEQLLVGILAAVLGVTFLVSFVDRLPLTMQRSLSFLPLPVDPIARASAEATTEWRVGG